MEGYQPWEVQTFTGIGNQIVHLVHIESNVLIIFQTAPEAGHITVKGVNGKGQAITTASRRVVQATIHASLREVPPPDPVSPRPLGLAAVAESTPASSAWSGWASK